MRFKVYYKLISLMLLFLILLVPKSNALDGRDVWKEGGYIELSHYEKVDYNQNYYTDTDELIEGNLRIKYIGMDENYMHFSKSSSDPSIEEIMDETERYVDPNTGKDKNTDQWVGVFTDLSNYKKGDIFQEIDPIEIQLPNGQKKQFTFIFEEKTEYSLKLNGKDMDIPVWKVGFEDEFTYTYSNYNYKSSITVYMYLSITNGVRLKGFTITNDYYLNSGIYERLVTYTFIENAVEVSDVKITETNFINNMGFSWSIFVLGIMLLVPITSIRNKQW